MPNSAAASAINPEASAKRIGALSSEDDMRKVLAHLGHDIRQPLSALESTAYFLSMHIPHSDERAHLQLEKLRGMADQMDWMLQDAMYFAQAGPGVPAMLDLFEAITETVTRGATPQVHLDLQGHSALVMFDPEQIRHLLRSMLHLAGHLDVGSSVVWLGASKKDGHVRVELRIPSLQLSHEQCSIEPFGRCLPGGSGLSIASIDRIAKQGGAILETSCTAPGGAVFSVAIPAA
jgi:nitrogen-specific signal transduction histidine kinase